MTTHHDVFKSPRYPEAKVLPISQDLTDGLAVRTVRGEQEQWGVSASGSFYDSISVCI